MYLSNQKSAPNQQDYWDTYNPIVLWRNLRGICLYCTKPSLRLFFRTGHFVPGNSGARLRVLEGPRAALGWFSYPKNLPLTIQNFFGHQPDHEASYVDNLVFHLIQCPNYPSTNAEALSVKPSAVRMHPPCKNSERMTLWARWREDERS